MDTLVRQDTVPAGPPASRTAQIPASPPPAAGSAAPELGRYVRALVDARAGIAAFTAAATVASVLLALVLPREWTARVVLLPTDDAEGAFPAQLSGLASSFGLQFPFGPASQSDLYPTILTSDRVLGLLLDREFVTKDGKTTTLLPILAPREEDPHAARMKAVRKLRKRVVAAAKDSETGIVSLEVTTGGAALSADVANTLTSLLETYLIEMRQQDGAKNRKFIDERLADASGALKAAEERLTEFRESNRRITGSPELQRVEARLVRDLMIAEQVFLELRKQQEIAAIESVKNTPVLKVLDEAQVPIRPSRPLRTLMVAAGLLLGAFLAVSWVLFRTALREAPDLAAALSPLATDLKRLLPRRRAPLPHAE